MAIVPSEDSDQPAHPRSMTKVSGAIRYVVKDRKDLQMDIEDSDRLAHLIRRWEHMQSSRKCYAPAKMIIEIGPLTIT